MRFLPQNVKFVKAKYIFYAFVYRQTLQQRQHGIYFSSCFSLKLLYLFFQRREQKRKRLIKRKRHTLLKKEIYIQRKNLSRKLDKNRAMPKKCVDLSKVIRMMKSTAADLTAGLSWMKSTGAD